MHSIIISFTIIPNVMSHQHDQMISEKPPKIRRPASNPLETPILYPLASRILNYKVTM